MKNKKFLIGCISVVLLLQAVLSAAGDINQKVASLNMATADLDDVIAVFGQPQKFIWGNQTITKDNLPATYIAQYGDGFSVVISNNTVNELRFEEQDTGYRFEGKLKVGSALQESLEVLDAPESTVENQKNEYADKVLYKDIDGQKGFCYYQRSDKHIRLFFANYKITALYLTNPAASQGGAERKPIDSIEPYLDVRDSDLRKIFKSADKAKIRTLTFNQDTVWPELSVGNTSLKDYLNDLVEKSKNPGLGVRQLHQRGITGKGVTVAIIDQPLYLDHPEFKGKIIEYHDVGCDGPHTSMHGPAVASLLVGTNCGTAPDAKLYYVAAPSWTKDTAYQAKALDWLIDKNKQLSAGQKIRVVSVSGAPSGPGSPFEKNTEQWDQACQRAEAEGMMVLDCTHHHGFIWPAYFRLLPAEGPAGCEIGHPGTKWKSDIPDDRLFVPTCSRTTAEQKSEENIAYIYWGKGGLSWAIPYCAGVLAMGWQVRPDATPEQMKELLLKTAYQTKDGAKIINPPQFIRALEKIK
jgi:hypothetical protein